MSVVAEFAMFPVDKGVHLSTYVGKIVEMIRQSGVKYQLMSMGTIIETETMSEALKIIDNAYQILEDCDRIYCSANFDIHKFRTDAMSAKVDAVIKKIGNVNI